jgi:hypothetical protein
VTCIASISSILMSNSCAKGSANITCENANSGVISLKTNAFLYIIDFGALYAKAPILDLQVLIYI